jgi:membrane fusion protein (multidrug efflux system)
MFGRIEIVYDHRDDALTVPRSALIEEDGETAVFVVDKAAATPIAATATKNIAGKTDVKVEPAKTEAGFVAHRKLVKVGYSDGDKIEIRSGLDEGASVITVGHNAVRDGTAVQILVSDNDKVLAEKATGAKG